MKSKILTKKTKVGQAFYLYHDKKEYYLFTQNYCKTVDKFFKNNVYLDDLSNYSQTKSTYVKNTFDKIKLYIKYIQKHYNLQVFYGKDKLKKNKKPYNRKVFNLSKNEYLDTSLFSA
jgi:hypothetical protein